MDPTKKRTDMYTCLEPSQTMSSLFEPEPKSNQQGERSCLM